MRAAVRLASSSSSPSSESDEDCAEKSTPMEILDQEGKRKG